MCRRPAGFCFGAAVKRGLEAGNCACKLWPDRPTMTNKHRPRPNIIWNGIVSHNCFTGVRSTIFGSITTSVKSLAEIGQSNESNKSRSTISTIAKVLCNWMTRYRCIPRREMIHLTITKSRSRNYSIKTCQRQFVWANRDAKTLCESGAIAANLINRSSQQNPERGVNNNPFVAGAANK